MKAARIHAFGPPEVLRYEDVADPTREPGQVRIKVAAAGTGPYDAEIRRGDWESFQPYKLPLILGTELAGVVEEADSASGWTPGDEVFGVADMTFSGAYAELAIAPADRLARKPASLSWREAAAVPVAAMTAQQALFSVAGLARGQRVLILGAAGAVGGFAVQLAKATAAEVVAAARPSAFDSVRQLGADRVIEADASTLGGLAGQFDVVFDALPNAVPGVAGSGGGGLLEAATVTARAGGTFVVCADPPSGELVNAGAARGVAVKFVGVEVTGAGLEALSPSLEARQAFPRVGPVLPLRDAARAHALLESRNRPAGKIVLEP